LYRNAVVGGNITMKSHDILCSKCNCKVGTKSVCECGRSQDFQFIKKCAPSGKGSAFFEKYICIDCDHQKVNTFVSIEKNMNIISEITKAILDASEK